MADFTRRAVVARVPALAAQRLTVVGRRLPVTVEQGTTIAECLLAIQRTGTNLHQVFFRDTSAPLTVGAGSRFHPASRAQSHQAA